MQNKPNFGRSTVSAVHKFPQTNWTWIQHATLGREVVHYVTLSHFVPFSQFLTRSLTFLPSFSTTLEQTQTCLRLQMSFILFMVQGKFWFQNLLSFFLNFRQPSSSAACLNLALFLKNFTRSRTKHCIRMYKYVCSLSLFAGIRAL